MGSEGCPRRSTGSGGQALAAGMGEARGQGSHVRRESQKYHPGHAPQKSKAPGFYVLSQTVVVWVSRKSHTGKSKGEPAWNRTRNQTKIISKKNCRSEEVYNSKDLKILQKIPAYK